MIVYHGLKWLMMVDNWLIVAKHSQTNGSLILMMFNDGYLMYMTDNDG